MIGRDAVVAEALTWVGTPFRYRASLKASGCDCLGLVRGVWRALIGGEPETLLAYGRDWSATGLAAALPRALERHLVPTGINLAGPGDVLLFRWRPIGPPNHLGIFGGPGLLIHAYESAGAVTVSPLTPAWRRRIAAAHRFPGVTD